MSDKTGLGGLSNVEPGMTTAMWRFGVLVGGKDGEITSFRSEAPRGTAKEVILHGNPSTLSVIVGGKADAMSGGVCTLGVCQANVEPADNG